MVDEQPAACTHGSHADQSDRDLHGGALDLEDVGLRKYGVWLLRAGCFIRARRGSAICSCRKASSEWRLTWRLVFTRPLRRRFSTRRCPCRACFVDLPWPTGHAQAIVADLARQPGTSCVVVDYGAPKVSLLGETFPKCVVVRRSRGLRTKATTGSATGRRAVAVLCRCGCVFVAELFVRRASAASGPALLPGRAAND
jgi:hypothetical protein